MSTVITPIQYSAKTLSELEELHKQVKKDKHRKALFFLDQAIQDLRKRTAKEMGNT